VLLGAFSGLSGMISFEAIERSIRHRFPGELGDKNVGAARRAYELMLVLRSEEAAPLRRAAKEQTR